MVGFAQLLTYGLLAFGALGVDNVDLGVRAAFGAAVFGSLAASLFGGTQVPGANVRVATTLILATLIAALAVDPRLAAAQTGRVEAIVFLAAISVAAAGVIQIAFGLARLGSLVQFVPHPVVAGFMNGLAILIVASQVPYLIGLAAPLRGRALLDAFPGAQPWTLGLGIATAALIWFVAARWKKLPAALIALFGGVALDYAVGDLVPSAQLGARLGHVDAVLPLPNALAPLVGHEGLELIADYWAPVFGTALVLAIISSLESLLAATAMDVAHNTAHRPNRELIGLGVGNLVSAACGGMAVSFSPAIASVAHRSGARSRLSGVFRSVVLLAMLMLGAPAFAYIPLAVLAGIMLTVAAGLVDPWSKTLMRYWLRGSLERDARWDLAVIATVCLVTVVFNFVVAVGFGLVASMGLFIASMHRSLVRASWNGLQRKSRRVYSVQQAQRLNELAPAIRVLELEGPVFFGTTARLARETEGQARDARYIILDFRRVGQIDATGAMLLERLSKRLAANGVRLLSRMSRRRADTGALSPASALFSRGRSRAGSAMSTVRSRLRNSACWANPRPAPNARFRWRRLRCWRA